MNQGTVTLPKNPNHGMAILPWLKDCRRALQQLRDRVPSTQNKTRPASSIKLPFAVSQSMDGETVQLSVSGGGWQEGATGEWVSIGPTEATEGDKAYLVIKQDENRAIVEDGVSIVITDTELDPVVIVPAEDPDPETATSNVLLAEVVEGKLIQRRHGNFTLGLWQIDGDVARWPETLVGTIPPPPPEPEP
jgi:hypothetical protein